MAVKYKKSSDQKKSAAVFHAGPNHLLKANTFLRSKAGWKYLLILILATAIAGYSGCSNHKSPGATSLVSAHKADIPSRKTNPAQNTYPEITGIKSINFLASHSPRLLTGSFNDLPHGAITAGTRLNLPGKVKLKRAKMLIVNTDTDDMAQTDSLSVGWLPVDPDDPAPLLRVTAIEGSLRARAQMKAYLDSLTIDPKSIGSMTNAQRMINSLSTLSIK